MKISGSRESPLDTHLQGPARNSQEESRKLEFLIFIPFLSTAIKLSLSSVGASFSYGLSMPVINTNPEVRDAIKRCDVRKMRMLFESRQAHPTDYLENGMTLLNVRAPK